MRGRPELPRRIENLDAIILQRATEDQSIGVFVARGGWLEEPFFLRFAEIASQPRSAEHIFRDRLDTTAQNPSADSTDHAAQANRTPLAIRVKGELGEHLWLISRWFYSNPRDGEILFRDKDWPYRRILRACSRLLAPREAPATETE